MTRNTGDDIAAAYAGEAPALGDNILAQISLTAEAAEEAFANLKKAEAALKLATERYRQIVEDELPSLMEAAGQRRLTTLDGIELDLDEAIYANISAERAPKALKWLVDNGHEALIKNEYTVAFPKNSKAAAEDFERHLAELRGRANTRHKVGVHASTLSAFVREEMEKGTELPLDLLGVTRKKTVKHHRRHD